ALGVGAVVLLLVAAVIVGHREFHAKNVTVHVTISSLYDQDEEAAALKAARAARSACENGPIHLLIGRPSKVTIITTYVDALGRPTHESRAQENPEKDVEDCKTFTYTGE